MGWQGAKQHSTQRMHVLIINQVPMAHVLYGMLCFMCTAHRRQAERQNFCNYMRPPLLESLRVTRGDRCGAYTPGIWAYIPYLLYVLTQSLHTATLLYGAPSRLTNYSSLQQSRNTSHAYVHGPNVTHCKGKLSITFDQAQFTLVDTITVLMYTVSTYPFRSGLSTSY